MPKSMPMADHVATLSGEATVTGPVGMEHVSLSLRV
jgi:hypothetical protein